MLTFRVGYKDIFGQPLSHDLIENGGEVPVTKENRLVRGTQGAVEREDKWWTGVAVLGVGWTRAKGSAAVASHDHATKDESPPKLWMRRETRVHRRYSVSVL